MNYNLLNTNKDNNNEIKKNSNDYINLMKEEIYDIQPPPMTHFSPKNRTIAPSGPNFKIINPSIGVSIKERNQIKTGGINFYEKFHKYSINEFNKTLQETLEWETNTKLKGNLINNLNNKIQNIINEENDVENENKNKKEKLLRKTFSG